MYSNAFIITNHGIYLNYDINKPFFCCFYYADKAFTLWRELASALIRSIDMRGREEEKKKDRNHLILSSVLI